MATARVTHLTLRTPVAPFTGRVTHLAMRIPDPRLTARVTQLAFHGNSTPSALVHWTGSGLRPSKVYVCTSVAGAAPTYVEVVR